MERITESEVSNDLLFAWGVSCSSFRDDHIELCILHWSVNLTNVFCFPALQSTKSNLAIELKKTKIPACSVEYLVFIEN